MELKMKPLALNDNQTIQNKIYTIRDVQVMLDRDLAELYGVETRVLNQAVKRNIERFPPEFMFQMTKDELEIWMSHIVISNKELMGLRKLPFVFTEQGVSMLSGVLKSDIAIQTSISIIKTFVSMRNFLMNNMIIYQKIESIEKRQLLYELKTDSKIDTILNAIEDKSIKAKSGIFYDGQMFDAYALVSDLIKNAKKSIALIDNYVDESILLLLSKRATNCDAKIYTKNITKQLELDLKKHNSQYPTIEIKKFELSHDRFLILDNETVYHFGASLKDLGKKWFAVSKMDIDVLNFMGKLK